MQLKNVMFTIAITGIIGIGLRPYTPDGQAQATPQRNVSPGTKVTIAPPTTGRPQRERSVFPLSGNAEAPCWVKPGETLHYTIRSIGQFETPAGGTPRNLDATARARPVTLRSIKSDSLKVRTAVLPNGERVYQVTGTARTEPGTYMDTWMTYNAPRDPTILPATPQLFVQTVFIMATPPTRGEADKTPPLPNNLNWQQEPPQLIALARTVHTTPKERAAAHLLPKLMVRLSEAQQQDLQAGKEVSISIGALPEKLKPEAKHYLDLACRRADGLAVIQFGGEPAQSEKFHLVILPGHDRTLGIDSMPAPDGTRSHF